MTVEELREQLAEMPATACVVFVIEYWEPLEEATRHLSMRDVEISYERGHVRVYGTSSE